MRDRHSALGSAPESAGWLARQPRQRDIARACGLHPATVSRLLAARGRLSPEREANRRLVLEAAWKLGYRPAGEPPPAPVIGILYPAGHAWAATSWAELPERLLRHLDGHGLDLRMAPVTDWDHWRRRGRDQLAGVIVADGGWLEWDELRPHLGRLPAILVNWASEQHDAVLPDDALGMRLLGQRLLALGHRRFLFVGSQFRGGMVECQTVPGHPAEGVRRKALIDLVTTAGGSVQIIDCDPALVVACARHDEGPTAIISYGGWPVVDLHRALVDAGVDLPGRVSLASGDDARWYALPRPGITGVELPVEAIAAAVVERLVERIAGADSPPRQVLLPPRLIERSSTGPARAGG